MTQISQATIDELRRLYANAIDNNVAEALAERVLVSLPALLDAAEACRKGREEAERKVDELRKQIQCGSA